MLLLSASPDHSIARTQKQWQKGSPEINNIHCRTHSTQLTSWKQPQYCVKNTQNSSLALDLIGWQQQMTLKNWDTHCNFILENVSDISSVIMNWFWRGYYWILKLFPGNWFSEVLYLSTVNLLYLNYLDRLSVPVPPGSPVQTVCHLYWCSLERTKKMSVYTQKEIVMNKLTWLWRLLLLSDFSRVRLCATPQTVAHQAPLSLGFSRQEHWSVLIHSNIKTGINIV